MYPTKELNDVRWLTKRQSIISRDKHKCVRCFKVEDLEVHHMYYTDGYHLWDYPDDSLVTLCRDCHQWWHDNFGTWYHVEPVKQVRKKKVRRKRRSRSKNVKSK